MENEMNFKQLKLKLKNELKTIAVDIRKLKDTRKKVQYGYVLGLCSEQQDFRIKRIAYCMLRGTSYEKIESKHRDTNDYTHKWCKKKADEYLDGYNKLLEVSSEDVCTSA